MRKQNEQQEVFQKQVQVTMATEKRETRTKIFTVRSQNTQDE
jgi:hypothetical protein